MLSSFRMTLWLLCAVLCSKDDQMLHSSALYNDEFLLLFSLHDKCCAPTLQYTIKEHGVRAKTN